MSRHIRRITVDIVSPWQQLATSALRTEGRERRSYSYMPHGDDFPATSNAPRIARPDGPTGVTSPCATRYTTTRPHLAPGFGQVIAQYTR